MIRVNKRINALFNAWSKEINDPKNRSDTRLSYEYGMISMTNTLFTLLVPVERYPSLRIRDSHLVRNLDVDFQAWGSEPNNPTAGFFAHRVVGLLLKHFQHLDSLTLFYCWGKTEQEWRDSLEGVTGLVELDEVKDAGDHQLYLPIIIGCKIPQWKCLDMEGRELDELPEIEIIGMDLDGSDMGFHVVTAWPTEDPKSLVKLSEAFAPGWERFDLLNDDSTMANNIKRNDTSDNEDIENAADSDTTSEGTITGNDN